MKRIKWCWEYSVYMCFCPYCDEPAYEQDKCVFCGKSYEWVEPRYKPTVIQVGEYTVTQSTNNHISITKDDKLIYHAQCGKKLTEEELAKQVEFYEKLIESTKK